MRKIYYLSSCDTCIKILKQVNTEGVELIDIKKIKIVKEDPEIMKKKRGS